jgi:Flp pilus assembly protein protease CpaA
MLAALTVFLNRSLFLVTPLEAFYGLITAFIVFLPLFIFRLIGGADLKVFTVLGSWFGIHGLAMIWIAATSGVLILFLVAYANAVLRNRLPLRNTSDVKAKIASVQPAHLAKHGSFVPYTVLLCAAALMSFGLRVVKKY